MTAFGLGLATQLLGLCCIFLQFSVFLLWWVAKLPTVLWMWFQVLEKKGKKNHNPHFPRTADYYLVHATWFTGSLCHCKGASLAHIQLDIQQEPPVLFWKAASSPGRSGFVSAFLGFSVCQWVIFLALGVGCFGFVLFLKNKYFEVST